MSNYPLSTDLDAHNAIDPGLFATMVAALRKAKEPNEHQIGSSGGWAQRGMLCAGANPNNVNFAPANGANGNPQNIGVNVVMNANFRVADMHTVQITKTSQQAHASQYAALATITWTVNGTNNIMQVDVTQSIQVCAPCEAVKVVVVDNTPLALQDNGTYEIVVTVTPRTRPYWGSPPTLTGPSATIPAAGGGGPGTVTVALPQNVGAVSVALFMVPLTGFPVTVTQESVVGDTPSPVLNYLYGGQDFVPIAAGVNVLTFSNPGGSPVMVTPIYGIAG